MAEVGLELLGFGKEFSELRERARTIEALGFDSIWMADNIIWKDHRTGEYEPVFEAWTTLAALAEATSRIRLGSLVTPARRRHPALLAKMASTVDIVSEGRLNLGMGTGDVESHFELWGMPLPPVRERVAILREEINILKQLWTDREVTFTGDYYRLERANNNPQPLQKPHPPIWLGLVLGRTLMPKLAAEMADALSIYNCSDVAAQQHLANVARYCEAIGRNPATIHTSRSLFVTIDEDERNLPTVEMDLTATLEEQGRRVKQSADPYNEYKRVTQRHVIGAPPQVRDELIRIIDIGFDHITILGLDDLPSLTLFAHEVLPTLQSYHYVRSTNQ